MTYDQITIAISISALVATFLPTKTILTWWDRRRGRWAMHLLLKVCTLGLASHIRSNGAIGIHEYAWYHGMAILWLGRTMKGLPENQAIVIYIPFVSKRLSRQRVGHGWQSMYCPRW